MFVNRKFFFLFIIIILSFVFSVSAQESGSRLKMFPELSSSSVISMVTVYPGNEIYSLFGHSSFRVYDPVKGIDWMFNYGTFDFDDPMFTPKFVQGQLDYYLSIDRFQSALRFYSERENRRVVEQIMNFSTEEKETVFKFLVNNSLPENRYYKYDFVHDNCSTRIADVLIRCFGSRLEFPDGKGKYSYRKMIDAYLTSYPALDAGIEIVLGSPADRKPAGIEKFFLPVPMIEGFDGAVLRSSGTYKRLVRKTVVLNSGEKSTETVNNIPGEESFSPGMVFSSPQGPETAEPGKVEEEYNENHYAPLISLKHDFNSVFYLLLFFPVIEIFLLISGKKRISVLVRIIKNAAETLFLSVSGTAGLLLSYLWFFSDHIVPNWNFHILWLSPLAVLYIFALLLNKRFKAEKYLSRILFASSLLFSLILVSGLQSISFTLLPLYLYSLLLFRRKGSVLERTAVKK